MSEKGIVFDVQRFSVDDGPGIRTTVFFKGCYLRCKWCHNPESISPKMQLSYDARNCILCGKCVDFVQGHGIEIDENKLKINFEQHDQNFDLIEVCPMGAYRKVGNEYSTNELLSIILKDKDYYENSKGGVTLSGGEAIRQINFVCKLGKLLKENGIHICLDISGYNPNHQIERTFDFVDEYLLDYKVTQEIHYKEYLGLEFDFIQTISILNDANKRIRLRCPIIPDVNDTDVHFKSICDLSNQYECIQHVDILPYHNMVKRNQFKWVNSPECFRVASEEEKVDWRKRLQINGLKKGVLESLPI